MGIDMEDAASMERKRRTFERYPALFTAGLVILAVSLVLMGWRQLNEQARLAEIFAGRGPGAPSAAFLAATQLELALSHIIEQLLFLGLAALKLGIGFSIAVIVVNLRETGRRGLGAFHRAGVLSEAPAIPEPWFSKFPRFLVAGFLVVGAFFLLSLLWAYNEYVPLGDQVTTRMVLEAIIKPGKMIGTGLLLFGIGSGLATIIVNLRMQAQALPALVVSAVRGTPAGRPDVIPPGRAVPTRAFGPLVAGFAIVLTAYVPLGAVLAWNRLVNLTSAGWSSLGAESLEVVLEHWIESYVLTGIAFLLFGIGLFLLTIVRSLRWQRERFLGSFAELSGRPLPAAPSPPRAARAVPGILAAGLAAVLLALGLTAVWIGAGLQALETGAASAVLADAQWEAFVKPFKFVGLAILFLGIGVILGVIVVNLQTIAMALPGLFARFADAARGRPLKPLDMPPVDPKSLFPKRLFAGILVGVAIVITATIPFAWPLRVGAFPALVGADLTADAAAQAAFALERSLEHWILPYKLAGLGIVFYAIGRFFATIIGFVRARRAIVTEGAEAIVGHLVDRERTGWAPTDQNPRSPSPPAAADR